MSSKDTDLQQLANYMCGRNITYIYIQGILTDLQQMLEMDLLKSKI